ncbi:hypothetical protein B9Q03_02950 [Candidatus Marsarchaeota G2 archaeon OSP_D]|jgi:hypothetical protein|uniref:Uncharacterized protein n=1 Tax=Candidatus Marsarchaeota G2 archaeon OSP_D TaxID=1978157 RepID=A0A2R6AZS8_9ARCH|nr:MAG: hypothetical protein B9Q03_02950 [Candidatus Marsarchaeota G2 archaeon OSP_D]
MVHEFIDYMGAALGMVLIFVSATLYLSGFAVSGIAYNTQQNMAAQAQSLLDYILTSTGSPANWGNQRAYPAAFGLQQANAPPYTLDPLKLMRLLATQPCTLPTGLSTQCIFTGIPGFYFFFPTPYYLPYTYTRSLIVPNSNFEFQFRLEPALNISILEPTVEQSGSGYDYTFPVRVYTSSGTPVGAATINATFVAAQCEKGGGSCTVTLFLASTSATTNTAGQAQLVFQAPTQYPSYSVVASVSVAGIQGLGFYSNPAKNTLVYVAVTPQTQNITVVRSCITTPCSVVYPNITTYLVSGHGLTTYYVCPTPKHLTTGKGFESVSCTGLPGQGVVAIGLANSNCNGQSSSPNCVEEALVAPVDLFDAFSLSIVYGGPSGQGPGDSSVSTTVSRVVQVGGFTYIATLTYWPDYGPVYGAGS